MPGRGLVSHISYLMLYLPYILYVHRAPCFVCFDGIPDLIYDRRRSLLAGWVLALLGFFNMRLSVERRAFMGGLSALSHTKQQSNKASKHHRRDC